MLLHFELGGPLHLCSPVEVSDQQFEKLLSKRTHLLCHSGQAAAVLHCGKQMAHLLNHLKPTIEGP